MVIDFCSIGNFAMDHIITPKDDYYAAGGTAFYCSEGLDRLIETSGSDMRAVLATRREKGRYAFVNKYGADMDEREQWVLTRAEPYTMADVMGIEARYIILGSLMASDFSVDVLKSLSERGAVVLDAQGFLREAQADGKVIAADWPDKCETLKYVDVLKVNKNEMETLTGCKDPREAALMIAGWGVREVLLTFGSLGSLIYDAACKRFDEIPVFTPSELVDATGCGDTYMMGYVFRRAQGATVRDAGLFAAAVATLKLQDRGPFRGTYAEAISMSASRPL